MNDNILIIGHARHGKDSFGELLGFSYESSSIAALNIFLLDAINEIRLSRGLKKYKDSLEAYSDRINHRKDWFELIRDYNSKDRAALAKNILSKNRVYVGMRCNEEYRACMDQGLFGHVFWVDASKRVSNKEPFSSFKIEFDPESMFFIDNNGSHSDLRNVVNSVKNELKL